MNTSTHVFTDEDGINIPKHWLPFSTGLNELFKYAQNQVLKDEKTLRADALKPKLADSVIKWLKKKSRNITPGM